MKYDNGKSPLNLVPSLPIQAAANVLGFGAKKYGANNWRDDMRETEWGRTYSSMQRHLLSFWDGEDHDPESGLLHIDHALTQLMILRMQYEHAKNMDNRYKPRTDNENE